jgi:hypothetical protein
MWRFHGGKESLDLPIAHNALYFLTLFSLYSYLLCTMHIADYNWSSDVVFALVFCCSLGYTLCCSMTGTYIIGINILNTHNNIQLGRTK